MKELSPQARVYMVLVIIAGYLAMGQMFLQSTSPSLTKLLVLLLLAVTCGPLQVRIPRWVSGPARENGREIEPVSVSLLFVFSALIELPARYAAMVAMAATLSQLSLGRHRSKLSLTDYLFHLSATNLSLLLAYDLYRLLPRYGVERLEALAAAAALHFLLHTWSRHAAVSLAQNRPVFRMWFRHYLPSAPLYGIVAVAGGLLNRLFDPSYLHTIILAFPVVCLFYYCYEFYFGRLRAERQHMQELSEMHRRTVEALALAIEAKDRVTSGHLRRVQRYALAVGRHLGCTNAELKALEAGALLHDIGKLAVPEHLLKKPGKLTSQEFNQIAIHPQVGAEILEAVNFPFPVAELVLCHHENWDGSGYPRRLSGERIPLTARILSVVDCFDALISDRPYRPAFPTPKAIEMMRLRRGSTFDPKVVDALLEMLPECQPQVDEFASAPFLRTPASIDAVQTSLTEEELHTPDAVPALKLALPAKEPLSLVLESMGSRLRVDQVMQVALAELGYAVPSDACALFLIEEEKLVCTYQSWPQSASQPFIRVPHREGPTGWTATQGEALINGNPQAEFGGLGSIARTQQWRDALIVPLRAGGQVVGTLNLYSKSNSIYNEDHARFAELLTSTLGLSLLRARAYEQAVQSTTDRQTGFPNAWKSLDLLREAIRKDSASLGVWMIAAEAQPVERANRQRTEEKLLLLVARLLEESLPDAVFLGRTGSNEFLVVLPHSNTAALAERMTILRHAIENSASSSSTTPNLWFTVSMGSAVFPSEADTAEALLSLARSRFLAERRLKPAAERKPPGSESWAAAAAAGRAR